MKEQGDLLFALDIGTRTVIGIVLRYADGIFEVLASDIVEHQERLMLDGQIHNVGQVADQVAKVKNRLEEILDVKLERVSIAAAGRALKTVDYDAVLEFEEKRMVTEEDLKTLEFNAIQQAQKKLVGAGRIDGEPRDYHFVAHSVKEYQLDGMPIKSLEGHKGKRISAKIIATFLPRVVVDSLLTVVNKIGLEVEYLTLEPIAAANVVIPKDMYNFNLALVDVGAGTSDIALTKGGAMLGYAMVPVAGDEITETLAEHYLLDYATGESIKRALVKGEELKAKNILSQEVVIKPEEALEVIQPMVQSLASQISEAILMLNNKAPQAVICVGGGSMTPSLLEGIAAFLEIPLERVGIKEYSDIKNIRGEIKDISNAQLSTPIGIAITSYYNKNKANFIDVTVNGYKHQIFTLNKAAVADALLSADIDLRELWGTPGMGLTCTVNGNLIVLKGEMGEPGRIFLNGEEISDLEREIVSGDEIKVVPGKKGADASGVVGDVVPELRAYTLTINGEKTVIKPEIYQNDQLVDRETRLNDGAVIKYDDFSTMRAVIAKLYDKDPEEIQNDFISYTINDEIKYIPHGEMLIMADNKPIDLDMPVNEELEYIVINNNRNTFTVKDIINSQLEESIEIVFNGSILTIPTHGKLYCNGKEITGDEQIKNGDELIYQERQITVQSVFDYINYNITPFLDSFQLTVNGKEAALNDFLKDGDRLTLTYKKDFKRGTN